MTAVLPIRYKTLPDGRVAVLEQDVAKTSSTAFPSRVVAPPALAEDDPGDGMEWRIREVSDLRVVFRWLDLVERVAREKNVPAAWILAMVYAESRGDEKAEAKDGGWGLMQITHPSLKAGRTKDQVFDPYTNLSIGAGVIASHARFTQDIAALASCYNAGGKAFGQPHASLESVWGMRETKGHISRVVAANNAAWSWLSEGIC